MAGFSVSGVGSGIDLASLLTQLIEAEKKAPTARLDKEQASARDKLSALGTIKSGLSGLQAAVDNLKAIGAFAKHTATSSDVELFTASADDTAIPGAYNVEVRALARAQKLTSAGFATPATVIGTGTLTIAVGAKTFSVTIGAANNTLAGIRDAINGAADNAGVRAGIITANDGAHLMLTGLQTGTAQALTVTRSGGDGGLDAIVYNPGVLQNLTVTQAAADATVVVDGLTVTSPGNSVTGVVNGVTLSLKSAKPGVPGVLTVASDKGAVKKAIADFVAAYNKVVTAVATATKYNADTKVAAPLAGDALARSISTQLRSLLGGTVAGLPGTANDLSDIGITTNTDGTLKVDDTLLTGAIDTNFEGVKALFTSAGGYVTSLGTLVAGYVGGGGLVPGREDALNGQLTSIATRREELQRHLDSMEARLRRQFSALDSLISKMNSTSNYLTSQLQSLNKSPP